MSEVENSIRLTELLKMGDLSVLPEIQKDIERRNSHEGIKEIDDVLRSYVDTEVELYHKTLKELKAKIVESTRKRLTILTSVFKEVLVPFTSNQSFDRGQLEVSPFQYYSEKERRIISLEAFRQGDFRNLIEVSSIVSNGVKKTEYFLRMKVISHDYNTDHDLYVVTLEANSENPGKEPLTLVIRDREYIDLINDMFPRLNLEHTNT